MNGPNRRLTLTAAGRRRHPMLARPPGAAAAACSLTYLHVAPVYGLVRNLRRDPYTQRARRGSLRVAKVRCDVG